MAAASKSGSPGRTITFILVGLVVLVCILAYNPWSLASQNEELMEKLYTLRLKGRELSDESKTTKESLEAIRVELSKAKLSQEGHRAAQDQWTKEKQVFKGETDASKGEVNSCKAQLATCGENQKAEKEGKEKAQLEKEHLQKEMKEFEDAPKVCDKNECTGYLREAVVVAAKLHGSNVLGNALDAAGFNSSALLEGINIPAPAALKVPLEQSVDRANKNVTKRQTKDEILTIQSSDNDKKDVDAEIKDHVTEKMSAGDQDISKNKIKDKETADVDTKSSAIEEEALKAEKNPKLKKSEKDLKKE